MRIEKSEGGDGMGMGMGETEGADGEGERGTKRHNAKTESGVTNNPHRDSYCSIEISLIGSNLDVQMISLRE